jgi:hypothetical protein
MKPLKLAALAALTLVSSTAAWAETNGGDTDYVFSTVDTVDVKATMNGGNPTSEGAITGILDGQVAPQTVRFMYLPNPSPCERMALMALQKPGRYFFAMKGYLSTGPGPNGGSYLSAPSCRLVRR